MLSLVYEPVENYESNAYDYRNEYDSSEILSSDLVALSEYVADQNRWDSPTESSDDVIKGKPRETQTTGTRNEGYERPRHRIEATHDNSFSGVASHKLLGFLKVFHFEKEILSIFQS